MYNWLVSFDRWLSRQFAGITFIFRLISTKTTSSGQSILARSASILSLTTFFRVGLVLVIPALVWGVFLNIFSPNEAYASFGSFAASFFTSTTEAANILVNDPPIKTVSSQNIALLAAVVSSNDPTSTVGVAPDINIVGGSALLADSGPLGTIADVEADTNPDTISLYTVRDGDNIQKIADMFGVSVNTILWGNDLRSGKDIKVGQELVILPVSGIKYVVQKGDTIGAIAKRYGGNVDEILRFNNMDSAQKLSIGDEIIIPNGEFVAPAPARLNRGVTKIIPTYINEAIDSLAYYIRPIVHGHKTQGLHGKNAVDLAPDCHCAGHEPILAAAAGQVIAARTGGWNGGYGNYVAISHPNGTQTLYGHMYSVSVHTGDEVIQGQLIGTVGSTGNSTGPHVHFEIRGAKNPF